MLNSYKTDYKMREYTIKDKEREFFEYLKQELDEFKEAIKDDDFTKLKQSTCDTMLLIDRF